MDNSYAAGLFDGEGYVRIGRWKKPNSIHIRYNTYAGIGMTHRPIIEQLHATYGGSLHMNRHDQRNQKYRIQFSCIWASQIASTFLRQIYPFTTVKKEQIEVALALQEHIDQNPYKPSGSYDKRGAAPREDRDEIMRYREELFHRITALKKLSYEPFTD